MLCFIRNKEKNRNGSGWAIFTPPKQFLGKECILGEIRGFFDVDYLEKIIGDFFSRGKVIDLNEDEFCINSKNFATIFPRGECLNVYRYYE